MEEQPIAPNPPPKEASPDAAFPNIAMAIIELIAINALTLVVIGRFSQNYDGNQPSVLVTVLIFAFIGLGFLFVRLARFPKYRWVVLLFYGVLLLLIWPFIGLLTEVFGCLVPLSYCSF